jgi:hypothetical protein
MVQAIAQYAKALKAINLALQNPAQQKSDATLASIILMGFFEVCESSLPPATGLTRTDCNVRKDKRHGLGFTYRRGRTAYQVKGKEAAAYEDWTLSFLSC